MRYRTFMSASLLIAIASTLLSCGDIKKKAEEKISGDPKPDGMATLAAANAAGGVSVLTQMISQSAIAAQPTPKPARAGVLKREIGGTCSLLKAKLHVTGKISQEIPNLDPLVVDFGTSSLDVAFVKGAGSVSLGLNTNASSVAIQAPCGNETLTLVTDPISPVVIPDNGTKPTSGKITVNGNTVVDYGASTPTVFCSGLGGV